MNTTPNDPIGQAIQDYAKNKKPFDIVVSSDICDDDIIPIEVLFRSYKDMPDIEKKALKLCKGDVLDVGAGAGIHCQELIKNGLSVHAIDSSKGAVDYLNKFGISRNSQTSIYSKKKKNNIDEKTREQSPIHSIVSSKNNSKSRRQSKNAV
jgi:SAM-dependent methyltransferase